MRNALIPLLLGAFLLAGTFPAGAGERKYPDGSSAAVVKKAPCYQPRPVHRGCVPSHNPVVSQLKRLREMQADAAREIAKAQRDQAMAADAKQKADAALHEAIAAKSIAERAVADVKKQASDEIAAVQRRADQALADADQTKQAANRKMDEAGKLMETARQLEASLIQARADVKRESDRVADMRKQLEQQLSEAQRRIRGTQLLQQATARSTAEALQKAEADMARAAALERQAQTEIATEKALQAKSKALNEELENQSKLLRARWEKIFDGMRNLDPCKAGQYADQKAGS